MRTFQSAAAAFCIACICAELTTLLVGTGWARKCIKAASGLYILVVLFRLVPGMKVELQKAAVVSPSSVSIPGGEQALLQGAQQQLEQTLSAECQRRFGVVVQLQITLANAGQTVQAQQVVARIPAGSSAQVRGQLATYLQEQHGTGAGRTGGCRMKEKGVFSVRTLAGHFKGRQGRAQLAAAVGVLAMVLILLSELLPQSTKPVGAESTAAAQSSAEYQAQLENRLERLISQMSGAGKTTVMVTLETGEEAIYALDTQSGEMQAQQTHVLLDDGSALTETVCLPQVRGVAVLCEGGADVRLAARITELVSALLDLPSNRICVEQRKG